MSLADLLGQLVRGLFKTLYIKFFNTCAKSVNLVCCVQPSADTIAPWTIVLVTTS